MRQPIGDTSCIGVLCQCLVFRIHSIPYSRRRIGIKERQIGQTHIAQSRLVPQASGSRLIVAHFLMAVHLRVVPTRESQILREIISEYG